MSLSVQQRVEITIIVTLSVVGNPYLPVFAGHGLPPPLGQIENSKTSMSEPNVAVQMMTNTVRPSVREQICHLLQQAPVHGGSILETVDSSYPAHCGSEDLGFITVCSIDEPNEMRARSRWKWTIARVGPNIVRA